MRIFHTELSNFWLSADSTTRKPLEIHQVSFMKDNLQPVFNNFLVITNVNLVVNKFSRHGFESIVPYRYIHLNQTKGDKIRPSRRLPRVFRNSSLSFEGFGYPQNFQPKIDYYFSEEFQGFIAEIPMEHN